MAKLQVLIATFGSEGLERIASSSLPRLDNVEWVVSCQCPGQNSLPIPEDLVRPDMHIHFSDSRGLSVNRNLLLDLATAPYCMIADDDLAYFAEGLQGIIEFFESNPEIDIAITRYVDKSGNYEKIYPNTITSLFPNPKGYFVTSFEIAFRRDPVINSGIRFNTNFGIGAPLYGSGEENLWIYDLNKARLRGCITTLITACHNGPTTGLRIAPEPRILRAQGAVISRIYPFTALLRAPLKAWRTARMTGSPLLTALKWVMKGWWEGFINKNLFR